MKIELGKTYVSRQGQCDKIVEEVENPIFDWLFRGEGGLYYSGEGKVFPNRPWEHDCDLVREYFEEGEEVEDMVNSPSHYTQGSVECIDAIQSSLSPEEFKGYLRGNILKYMWRTNHKGGKQDLEKSLWYLNKLIGATE